MLAKYSLTELLAWLDSLVLFKTDSPVLNGRCLSVSKYVYLFAMNLPM